MGERTPARFCVPSALTEHRCSAHTVPRRIGGMVAADCENTRPDTQRARRRRAKSSRGAPERACAGAVSAMPVGRGQLRRDSPVRRVHELRSTPPRPPVQRMRRRSCTTRDLLHIRNAGGAGTTPPRLAQYGACTSCGQHRQGHPFSGCGGEKHILNEYIEVCCVVMPTRACSGGRNVYLDLATRLKPCNDADQHDSRRCPPVSSVGASEIRDAVYSRYTSRLSFGVIVSGSELRWQHIASTGRACRRPTLPATRECAVGRHRGPRAPGRRLAHTSNLAGRIRCRYELAAHHAVANIDAGVRHDWARERAADGAWLRTRRVRPLPARCRGQSGWPNDFRSPSSTTKS